MRIRPAAVRYARSLRKARGGRDFDDDDLGGLLADAGTIAGSIIAPGIGTAIGGALGGALEGGGGAPAASAGGAAGASTGRRSGDDTASLAAALARKAAENAAREAHENLIHRETASLPTHTEVRAAVESAIRTHAATQRSRAVQTNEGRRAQTAAVARTVNATVPLLRRINGALTEQRLQRQAQEEHQRLLRQQERDREREARFRDLDDGLDRALAVAHYLRHKFG